MPNRVLRRANRSLTIGAAASVLAASYFLSGLFGLFRDRLLAARFGIEGELDAYFAAFSIPDLMFFILVSGALTVTLLPVLNERFISGNKKSAWEISSSMVNLLGVLTLVASVLIFIFAGPLMSIVAPSFDEARHEIATNVMRILALNPFLFSLSSVFGTIQQAYGRFFFFAIAPVVYNGGIIFGILSLTEAFGIYGVAMGAVIGAIAQLGIQMLGVAGLGFTYTPNIFWKNQGFRKVIKLIIPRSIDEGLEHLTAVIERAIASGLAAGSIAAYQIAFNLKNYPITLIGTAIATAAFPKISERALSTRTDLLKKEILGVLRAILWFAIPTAIAVVLLRGYIVRLLIGFGDVTIANVLGWFAIAILFQSMLRLITRIFYAKQDTKTPLYVSGVAIVVNVTLAIILARIYGVMGLAMAQSFVAIVEVAILGTILSRRFDIKINKAFAWSVGKIIIASLAMGTLTYTLLRFVFPLLAGETGFFTLAPKFSAIVLLSFGLYVWVGSMLGIDEAKSVIRRVRAFAFKRLSIG